jgi:hypothetical protein
VLIPKYRDGGDASSFFAMQANKERINFLFRPGHNKGIAQKQPQRRREIISG